MVVTDTDWEDFDDLDSFGISICLSTGRPTAHEGRHIYETDTNKTMVYTGAAWEEISGTGGVTDHGALTGLADDDHTQYVLVNGTRDMTGDLTINKVGPKVILEPTDSDSPALILEDTASNYKGRVYVTGDDMVVLGEDGELYLSTAVTTGGNVLLETKGVTRLTVADALITSTVDVDINDTEVKANSIEVNAGGSGDRFAFIDFHGDDTYTDYGLRLIRINTGLNAESRLTHRGTGLFKIECIEAADIQFKTSEINRLTIADAGLTSTVPLAMGTNKITGLGAATANGDALRYEQLIGAYLPLTGGTLTGNLSMGANNVYLDSGILRMSDGTALSGSIGFTTGVQNYIQRQLVSGSDYTLLSDQDYMHTWAILGAEKMHLSTADGLKLFTKINMNGLKIEGVLDPTANQEAATKKYVDDTTGVTDHSLLSNLTWSTAGHTINTTVDMNNNNITDINELWFNTSDPGIKFDTGDFIWFDTSENRTYFEIASTNICYVKSTGIHPNTDSTYYLGSGSAYWKGLYADDVVVESGTYVSGDGAGNMELHVATGKTVKIVVG